MSDQHSYEDTVRRVQEMVADDPVAVHDEVPEQLEHVRFDVHRAIGTEQRELQVVELEFAPATATTGARLTARGIVALLVASLLPMFPADPASAEPTANDAFSAAEAVSGALPISVSGTNIDATKEPGEPEHAGHAGNASVWYRWTATTSDVAVVSTCGSDFDTLLGVYTGSTVDSLTQVAADDDACGQGGGSRLRFAANATETYWIAVDGWEGATGLIVLEVRAAPSNDSFASARTIASALPVTVVGATVDGTSEAGEPHHAGHAPFASVWFTWTAPSSAPVVIDSCSEDFEAAVAVYTGDTLGALVPIAGNDGTVFADCGYPGYPGEATASFSAAAGTTYRIAVDVGPPIYFPGAFRLTIRSADPPTNDAFADAQALTGALPITRPGSNVDATNEAGEPAHAGRTGGESIWYRWTASTSEPVVVETCGSAYEMVAAVYRGDAVEALTPLASSANPCGSDAPAVFTATAGQTYRIALDGHFATGGAVALTLRRFTPPANDAFGDASVLDGRRPRTVRGTNADATAETGEPDHADLPGGASIWYRWTPAASGPFVIETCGSDVDTLLGVYTGTGVNDITPVASNHDTTGCGDGTASRVNLTASAGTTYSIAVDGLDAVTGSIALTVRGTSPPVNDSFEDARVLDGRRQALPVTATGTNVDATLEPGEPGHGSDNAGASVWYRWTPDASGPVVIETCDSDVDTLLAVYTGSAVDDLAEVAGNDDGCSVQSRVSLAAVAGQTYRIAVAGYDGATGAVPVRIRVPGPPANDTFAAAQILDRPVPLSVNGTTMDGSREPGEPDHAPSGGSASVWYSWTPTTSGPVIVDGCRSAFAGAVAVYTGNEVTALTEVANEVLLDCAVEFTAISGQTYRIAVDGSGSDAGRLILDIRYRPANDDFTHAEALPESLPISVRASNQDAYFERGEPSHAGRFPRASVWYRWTSPTSGPVRVDTCGSRLDTLLGVYTGSALTNLTEVASNGDACGAASVATFTATVGETYLIAVDGLDGAMGTFNLRIRAEHETPR